MSEKVLYQLSTVAEMTNGIILANYEKVKRVQETYQTEAQLESKLIENLVLQGYERLVVRTNDDLYTNLKTECCFILRYGMEQIFNRILGCSE